MNKKHVAQLTQQFTEFSHKPAGADSSKSVWGLLSSAKSLLSSGRYLQAQVYDLRLALSSEVTANDRETHVEVVRDYTTQVPCPSDSSKQGIQIRKTMSHGLETQVYERWDSRTKKEPPTHQSVVRMTRKSGVVEIQVQQLDLPAHVTLSKDALKSCPSTPHSEKIIEIRPFTIWCQEVSQLGQLLNMPQSNRPSQVMIINEDDLNPVYFNYSMTHGEPVPPIVSLPIQPKNVVKLTLVPEQLPGLKRLQKLTIELYFEEDTHAFLGVRGPLRGIASDALIIRDDF